jgi:Adenylate and Guanylate cyclase catalytic domain
MESTGKPNLIQLSQETARLLQAAGKASWIKERDDKIHAKGKGLLQTYFLEIYTGDASFKTDLDSGGGIPGIEVPTDFDSEGLAVNDSMSEEKLRTKIARLVAWNTNVLLNMLQQIASTRSSFLDTDTIDETVNESLFEPTKGQTVLDEVKEIIALPGFDAPQNIKGAGKLDPRVSKQLHTYLTTIASMYRQNPCKL